MLQRRLKFTFALVAIMFVGIFMYAQINKNSFATEEISNKFIGWGIKRNDNHMQPDLGSENKMLIDKYGGIAIGNKDSKSVYLTFDLGYEAGYTETILNTLKENDITATFFITAHYLNTSTDLVKKMIENGNIVGNQSPHTLMEL